MAAHVITLASCPVAASTATPWTRAVKSERRLTRTSGCPLGEPSSQAFELVVRHLRNEADGASRRMGFRRSRRGCVIVHISGQRPVLLKCLRTTYFTWVLRTNGEAPRPASCHGLDHPIREQDEPIAHPEGEGDSPGRTRRTASRTGALPRPPARSMMTGALRDRWLVSRSEDRGALRVAELDVDQHPGHVSLPIERRSRSASWIAALCAPISTPRRRALRYTAIPNTDRRAAESPCPIASNTPADRRSASHAKSNVSPPTSYAGSNAPAIDTSGGERGDP